MSPNIANAYMVVNMANMAFTSLTLQYENIVFLTNYYTYDWFEVPYEKYFN